MRVRSSNPALRAGGITMSVEAEHQLMPAPKDPKRRAGLQQ